MTDTTTYQRPPRRAQRRHRLRRLVSVVALGALGLGTLSGCAPATTGVVTLDFFQFKAEAIGDFDTIIAEFEAANPDIHVVQNSVPDPDTAIRTLLVKNKVPDVLSLGGSGNLGQLARAGVFHDFTGDPLLAGINPAVQKILAALGTNKGTEVNALGMVSNANGVLYNRDIFAAQGIAVPTTWDELIAAADKLTAAGITPFYGTLADAWTAQVSLNGIGAQLGGKDFFPDLRKQGADVGASSAVSFEKNYPETFAKLAKLYSYAQPGYLGKSYADGNLAFAHGESAMLMQGIWALAPILANNPDINVGSFPYPVTDNPEDIRLVSGVDVAITIGRDTPHYAESKRFVDFLLQKETVEKFAASQNMFSGARDAAPNANPALAELQPYFTTGQIVGFIDHQIPASIPLGPIVQQFLTDKDSAGALATLDNDWRKVAARTPSTRSGD
ncbi:extracellular solute-binding protein [Cryobacterium breve]|uniref:Extracellular solute-binding protein n=1 Tax=Cryobacterium breve TaxID=1259258 RepID=A0ABY7NB99_9MICO|nr:extracellular solute-binding protein [Cryobacterium breve]WBM79766.1 extracellular solute-binding protein [Cryobacterium breve]